MEVSGGSSRDNGRPANAKPLIIDNRADEEREAE
jgi:hypothetical protein